jgi:cytochrome c-type biogenesis protein CcmF
MAPLGSFLLLATFVVCTYAGVVSVVGARRRSRQLIESGIGAFHLITGLMTLATGVIVNAFLTDDFSIRYVQRNSDTVQPFFYKVTAYWGALDGSLMFWVFLLAICASIAVHVNRERQRELIPYVVAVIAAVQMFFVYLLIVHNNPFTTFLGPAPQQGEGMSPLLQNYWMVIHPPSLYTGFVGMTIPFAFGMAALITGHLDDSWLRAVRRWTMFGWFFLSLGLTLGGIWAYEELGWGGYWMWDPVENAGLLPWFTATAFLHSVMVQERRSMLRVWNVMLVIMTFLLTIFGTFMTRSGVVSSVHAFGDNPQLAWLFGSFIVVTTIVSFGWVIYRLPLLQARNELDSWLSREAAFLVNNWILLFCAFFILFVTMFPTLTEAITGDRITVSAPFYNQWMKPIGLTLLLLTGIGPLLGWRKSTLGVLKNQFLWPVASGVVVFAGVLALGFHIWASGLCFALCGFVLGTIVQEFWRGASVRRRNTGTDMFTALIGLMERNKRRYGGYVVHLGIVLIFFGFAGEGFKQEAKVHLAPGQTVSVGRYTIRHDRLGIHDDGQKQAVTAYMTVFKGDQQVDTLYPAKWIFHKREAEPTTEVAIRRTVAEDLYLAMSNYDPGTQSVQIEAYVNPLVNWVWFGFGIMAIGTIIALLPERAFSFAAEKLPAKAAASSAALLLALFLAAPPLRAQHVENPGAILQDQLTTPVEKSLGQQLICMCGGKGCGKALVGTCSCGFAPGMRAEIKKLVAEGKSEQQVLDYYVAKYNSYEPLAWPPDTGFNRLAWLFPYLLGASGAVAVGFVALRWSKRRDERAHAEEPAAPVDPTLEDRLDDELRNLD